MHFADAFIQSDLQYIPVIHFFFISMCVPWELNPQPLRSTTEPQEHFVIVFDSMYVIALACSLF